MEEYFTKDLLCRSLTKPWGESSTLRDQRWRHRCRSGFGMPSSLKPVGATPFLGPNFFEKTEKSLLYKYKPPLPLNLDRQLQIKKNDTVRKPLLFPTHWLFFVLQSPIWLKTPSGAEILWAPAAESWASACCCPQIITGSHLDVPTH